MSRSSIGERSRRELHLGVARQDRLPVRDALARLAETLATVAHEHPAALDIGRDELRNVVGVHVREQRRERHLVQALVGDGLEPHHPRRRWARASPSTTTARAAARSHSSPSPANRSTRALGR